MIVQGLLVAVNGAWSSGVLEPHIGRLFWASLDIELRVLDVFSSRSAA